MQTDDAHSPRELWFDGKAIDIKGCISTEGRRMWENLRQRPVDLLLRTRMPQFFPRNPPGILRLKNAYYPRSSRIAGGKDPWRRLRDLAEESYWLIRGDGYESLDVGNKIVRFAKRKKEEHYKYYDIDELWEKDYFYNV